VSVSLCHCDEQQGETVVMIFCSRGHPKYVSMLVSRGADVNMVKENGDTALILAACRGHHECVSILIANGAVVDFSSEVKLNC
jgi:ankyrin repeat protein